MVDIIYPNIVIKTITDKITKDNYSKQNYTVFDKKGNYLFTLYSNFISLPIAEGICSGDFKRCSKVLNTYANNIEEHSNQVNNFLIWKKV